MKGVGDRAEEGRGERSEHVQRAQRQPTAAAPAAAGTTGRRGGALAAEERGDGVCVVRVECEGRREVLVRLDLHELRPVCKPHPGAPALKRVKRVKRVASWHQTLAPNAAAAGGRGFEGLAGWAAAAAPAALVDGGAGGAHSSVRLAQSSCSQPVASWPWCSASSVIWPASSDGANCAKTESDSHAVSPCRAADNAGRAAQDAVGTGERTGQAPESSSRRIIIG